MRRFNIYMALVVLATGLCSCPGPPAPEPNFEDTEDKTIFTYIEDSLSAFSDFMAILKAGGIDRTLSAYNPDGDGYTLFLPDNAAVKDFISSSSKYNSLDDLLQDHAYVSAMSRYHVVNKAINANDFPFGALPELTLSDDRLTISFVVEPDTSYYKVNNQAPVVGPNVELSNGYVHIISKTLLPITFTSYDWLGEHEGFSIYMAALEATGLADSIDFDSKDEEVYHRPTTLLVEPDSIYNENGIYNLQDLIDSISPARSDYTNTSNPLYNFVGYHILVDSRFLDDFAEVATNYITYSEVPLNINGLGLDLRINWGKQVFDTLIAGEDTTLINYIGFFYDESNVITQSGSIHFIDRVLKQKKPSQATRTFGFGEEPRFNEFRQEPGEYIIDDPSVLQFIKWTGPDLFYVFTDPDVDPPPPAWGGDNLFIDGDFSITYSVPRIIQGKYTVRFRANGLNRSNALVEVFIDGKAIGGLVDLSNAGGTNDNPYVNIELGTIDFLKYEAHTIRVSSLIPGRLQWDVIQFIPFSQN